MSFKFSLQIKRLLGSPYILSFVFIGGATAFLFAPLFRGDVPLPTRSIPGLTWGAPNQPAQSSIFRDRIVQSYPYHLFAAQIIQDGHLPLWNNLIFNGTTFFANGQAGVLSLLKLPFWWLPAWLGYDILTVLQSIVAGLGMFVLGKKLGWKPAAGIIAGLTLTLSAPFVMRLTVTTMSAVIACLPWVLWAILRLHDRLAWRRMAIVAALIAVMVLAGHVQLAAFSFGFTIFWTLIWWRRERWPSRVLLFVAAFSLGLGLSAVQLIPVKESLDLAYRQPAQRSWATVLNPQSLFAFNLKQAASLGTMVDQNALGNETHYRGPGNYLEGNLYIGPLAILFILASSLAWRKRWWRGTAVLAVLISGFYMFPGWWDVVGKIAPWITVTPVWRTSFMFVFSLSLLAGVGANEIFTRRWSRWAWPLAGLMAVTMLLQWQGILPFAPRGTLFARNPLLDQAFATTRDGTTLWTPNGTLDQFMPYDIPIAMGYDSVYPRQYLDLWSANAELRQRNQLHVKDPSPQLLAVAGANLMLTSVPLPSGWTIVTTSGYWTLAKKNDAVPPIHTVASLLSETNPAQISSINPATSALVRGTPPVVDTHATTTVTVTDRTATKLQVHVTSTRPTALVTNLQSYPGWKLTIDGRSLPAALLNVNHAFLGAAVSYGNHDVIFSYQPRSYFVGFVVTIVSLLVLITGFWIFPKMIVR